MVVAELAGFIKEPSKLVRLSFLSLVAVTLEQFSIDCCKTKTKTKVVTQDLIIILQTVCQMILIMLVWRIWYWIN